MMGMYLFIKYGKSTTFVPLTPRQVYKEQLKLKRKSEVKRSEMRVSTKDSEKQ
jgi:hypothetical protein